MESRVSTPPLPTIRSRLAATRPRRDPRARLLANVAGPVSPALLEIAERPARAASVLVPILERATGLTVLLTERAAHLKDHAGQVSLPGGRLAEGETPIAAALREAEEEIGLAAERVTVLGLLDELQTGTGFTVTPVVALVAPEHYEPRPDPREVANVFEIPLELVLDAARMAEIYVDRHGSRYRMYELHYGRHRIWGATAAILRDLRQVILDDKTDR